MCLPAAVRQISGEAFQDVPFPERSTKDVRKRLAALLRLGTRSFAEHMSIRSAATLVLSNKSRDGPRARAASTSEELVRALNAILGKGTTVKDNSHAIEAGDYDRPDDSQIDKIVMQRAIQVIEDQFSMHPALIVQRYAASILSKTTNNSLKALSFIVNTVGIL
jgi:hypothetical protein